MSRNHIILIVLALLIVAAGVFLILRSPEDDWICVSGQWVKHGNPSVPMPTRPCGSQNNSNTNNAGIDSDNQLACELVTSAEQCEERADCLPVDYCSCATDRRRAERCGEDIPNTCLCDRGGFDYCVTLDCENEDDSNQYYENLAGLCSDECCRSSVDSMKLGEYRLAPAEGCGQNQKKNTLKCVTSYTWCEPKTEV